MTSIHIHTYIHSFYVSCTYQSILTPEYSVTSPGTFFGTSPFRKSRNSLCLFKVHAGQLTIVPVISPRPPPDAAAVVDAWTTGNIVNVEVVNVEDIINSADVIVIIIVIFFMAVAKTARPPPSREEFAE